MPLSLTLPQKDKLGLTSFQIKMIALVCMTLDHLAAFGREISFFSQHYFFLRTLGRIAAPLFLFILVQGVRHTKNRPRFILRLYLAGVSGGLFITATNFFFGNMVGIVTPGNIIFTFLYVVLFIELFEKLTLMIKARKPQAITVALLIITVTFVPHLINISINENIPQGITYTNLFLIQGLCNSFFPSLFRVEYSCGFVLLGVILYFAKTKRRQCITFAIFCLFCVAGAFAVRLNPALHMSVGYFGMTFFDFLQLGMIMALPFMMLYNGHPGTKCKWFFYWYYPTHRYLIHVISAIVT